MDPHILAQSVPASEPRSPEGSPAPVSPRLAVVVVDYHQTEDTIRLVRQLRQSHTFRENLAEIVVLENAARRESRLRRLRKIPGVTLRRSSRNHGFARAVNVGCERGQAGWLLLLNPDVTLPEDFLDQVAPLLDRLEQDQSLGIVGLGLRNEDGTPQLSTGPYPTLGGSLLRLLLPRSSRKYHRKPVTHSTEVEWVTGCCMLVRRACWEQLGGFDPAFFLYYEDVDLCRRARLAGWRVVHDPSLSITHHRPLHGRRVPAHLRMITRHALLTYARKHWTQWSTRFLANLIRVEGWTRSLWARLCGQKRQAEIFTDLARLARDLAEGRADEAEQRLQRIVQQHEELSRASTPVGDHPQP